MIQVNDEPIEWHDGLTVRQMLSTCKYLFPLVIVTINDSVVSRSDFDTTVIPDSAVVKVIHLISGG